MRSRAIYGCAGTSLSAAEKSFFREARPWGFILFARNISDSAQVQALVVELRDTIGDGVTPILIDQEGGRVTRLKPPHWCRSGSKPDVKPRCKRLLAAGYQVFAINPMSVARYQGI